MAIMGSTLGLSISMVVLTSDANGPGKNNGLAYTAFPGGTVKIQRSNNNKTSKSQSYQSMDQQVVNLDAFYDALSDKEPWDVYAAAAAGQWAACVTCNIEATAKKLFRQMNMWRDALGLPLAEEPPGTASWTGAGVALIRYDYNASIGEDPTIIMAGTNGEGDFLTSITAGMGLKNPFIEVPYDQFGTAQKSGPYFDEMLGIITKLVPPPAPGGLSSVMVTSCTFLNDGSPGSCRINGCELLWTWPI